MRPKPRTYELLRSPLYGLSSRKYLAQLLGVTSGELRGVARDASRYSEWDIDKKNGGLRHIENPCERLKRVQRRLASLLSRIEAPGVLFCPVKGRSYVDNAERHKGNRVVRCLDIKDYFRSTTSRKVFWFFYSVMKCPRDIAGLLTRLATYNGHLPTGSPLSPILAFYANYDTWRKVSEFCEQSKITLTIYIDDITLSGHRLRDGAMWRVKAIIHGGGLSYHKEKKYIGGCPEVTGIILSNDTVQVPRRQHKRQFELRQKLRSPLISHASLSTIRKLESVAAGLDGQFCQVNRANQKASVDALMRVDEAERAKAT